MLSHQLISQIESHWEQITERVLGDIRSDPQLAHIAGLPEWELSAWGRNILKNLGHWLSGRDEELAARYESLGRVRYEEGVPLHEAVRGLHLLKDRLVDFVRGLGFAGSTVEIYAEEELEFRVSRFFDWLVWHLVRGYETALREAVAHGHYRKHAVGRV
jgi:hypothetical protein